MANEKIDPKPINVNKDNKDALNSAVGEVQAKQFVNTLTKKFDQYKGVDKASIIILMLGEDRSRQIMSELDKHELVNISRSIQSMGIIPHSVMAEAVQAVKTRLTEGQAMVGSPSTAKRLLQGIIPDENINEMIDEVNAPIGDTVWERLSNTSPSTVANVILNENPQASAIIMSHLNPSYASKVMAYLNTEQATKLIIDVITLNRAAISRDTIHTIEQQLQIELIPTSGRSNNNYNYSSHLAEVLNRASDETSTKILAELAKEFPTEAANIQSKMFTFSDFIAVDADAIREIINVVEDNVLYMALKGADEELKDHFINSIISERSKRAALIGIESLGQQRRKDILSAQDILLQQAKMLENKGVIALRGENEDNQLI